MAADNWKRYDSFPEYIGDGTIDMDNDTFNVALFLSTSNAATTATTVYGSVTNEHANGNGYATKGQALDSVTWVTSTSTTTFDCASEVFTASGGSIVCRFAVIFSDTAAADQLVCFSLLDNAPADVTATDTNTLTIAIHASGIMTVTGGQS